MDRLERFVRFLNPHVDDEALARIRARRGRYQRFQKLDDLVWGLAALGTVVFGLVWLTFL